MPSDGWNSIGIRQSLLEEAERIARERHFPNVTQYVNEALRQAVERDKERVERHSDPQS